MKLAPICIPAYIRVDHLKQTISALQKNTLAPESELFVFSDGPRPGHEAKVQAVRDYLKTIKGFKRVEIVERPINIFPENSRQGWRRLLDEYGRVILMEEDIVTAPSFLDYMNYMLDAYQDNKAVFSIAGYCPPIKIPKDYRYDVFIHPRFNPWGFGTWKDRFDLIEMKIQPKVIKYIFLNAKNLYKYNLQGGARVIPLTLANYFGDKDGGDIKLYSQQFVMGLLTVYPVRSLVDNIGVDGSGVHTRKKSEYRVSLPQEPFKPYSLPPTLQFNKNILKSYYRFKSGNLLNQVALWLWAVWIVVKSPFRPRKI